VRRASSGRGRARRARVSISIIVATAFLAVPGTAAAHSGVPTVALDFRLGVSAATRALHGIRVDLVDGDRGLRLRVDPKTELTVLGEIDEPFLRFAPSGVWVNRSSPTAEANRLVGPAYATARLRWSQITNRHSFRWHDHRLAPPRGARTGVPGRWSIPVLVDGQRRAIGGSFVRVPRPRWWLWLAGSFVLAFAVAAVARRRPQARPQVAVVLGMLAAVGALAGSASFASRDALTGAGLWGEIPAVAALLLIAAGSLRLAPPSARPWTAAAIGAVSAAITVNSLGVFWHGAVISSLPAAAARLTVALAVAGGIAAVLLGFFSHTESPARRASARSSAPRRRAAGRSA
jgi:hypothetical protein